MTHSLFINHQTIPRSTAWDRRSSIGTCGSRCKRWLSGHEDCKIFRLYGGVLKGGGGGRKEGCGLRYSRFAFVGDLPGSSSNGSDGSGSACFLRPSPPPPANQPKNQTTTTSIPPPHLLLYTLPAARRVDQLARLNSQRPPVPTTTQKQQPEGLL